MDHSRSAFIQRSMVYPYTKFSITRSRVFGAQSFNGRPRCHTHSHRKLLYQREWLFGCVEAAGEKERSQIGPLYSRTFFIMCVWDSRTTLALTATAFCTSEDRSAWTSEGKDNVLFLVICLSYANDLERPTTSRILKRFSQDEAL